MYLEKEYDSLHDNTPPEMQRLELSGAVLQLKALGIDNVVRFPFPSPPPARHLVSAYELLHALTAIDNSGNLTQPLGLRMAEFPLPPLHAKALLVSGEKGNILMLLYIFKSWNQDSMAVLSNINYHPMKNKWKINPNFLPYRIFQFHS